MDQLYLIVLHEERGRNSLKMQEALMTYLVACYNSPCDSGEPHCTWLRPEPQLKPNYRYGTAGAQPAFRSWIQLPMGDSCLYLSGFQLNFFLLRYLRKAIKVDYGERGV